MLGAVIGGIVGSVYEFHNHHSADFPLFSELSDFTDNSVLSFATAKALLDGWGYASAHQDFSRRYPGHSYGSTYACWIF
ncbi:MAG: hypothetical protein WA116_05070 [Anaerolineaceae bacterium]